MRQLTAAMRAATADPPPTTLSLDDLITGELRRRRQSRVRLLAVAGAVILVATTAPVVLGQAGPAWSPAGSPPRPPVTVRATTAPPGDHLVGDGSHDFTGRAAAVVERSLPDGYRMAGRPVEYWAAEFSLMWADLAGPDGRRTQLLAYRVEGGPGPTGDACGQAPLDGTRFAGREQACEPLVVAGETFRVATSRDVVPATEDEYEFTIVTRYGEGWTLHLWELPYPHPFSDLEARPTGTPVFTARQLAELASDPGLNP